MTLNLLTVNIGAPSENRARRQLEWLAARTDHVVVLTETKGTTGSRLLADAYAAAGFAVTFPDHPHGELGVMIVSSVAVEPDPISDVMAYLPARLTGVRINTSNGPIRVLGAYVPSRDGSMEKTERKRRWIATFHDSFEATVRDDPDTPVVLLGDLNVLEPQHQPPHRGQFAPFEYAFYTDLTKRHGLHDLYRRRHPDGTDHSWARRPELGYRYDHAHASASLDSVIDTCVYVHETRVAASDGTRLTDHSGLAVSMTLTANRPLLTSAPTAATSQGDLGFTLF